MRGKSNTRYGLKELFEMIDLNSSGTIEANEWKLFYNILLKDFMKCDTNQNWRISLVEAKTCIRSEQWYKLTSQDGFCGNNCTKGGIDPIDDLMTFSDRNADGELTLEEYVYIRKAASSWRQCVMGTGMNYKELECGLKLISDSSGVIQSGDARKALAIGLTWQVFGSRLLNFSTFVKLSSFHRLFRAYC